MAELTREDYRLNRNDCLRDVYLAHGGSHRDTAKALGVPRPTVSGWISEHKLAGSAPARVRPRKAPASPAVSPGASIDGDTATVTLPEHPKRAGARTPDEVLRDHGLDPEQWDVTSYKDNYWEGNNGAGPTQLAQSKVTAKRKVPTALVLPARTDSPLRAYRVAPAPTAGSPLLIALPGDQHCPHEEPGLDACWLAWVRHNQPDKIVGVGDILNLSKPHAKHRANLDQRHNDTPAECYQAGHDWWRRTLDAAGEDCEAEQIPGNHDLRSEIAIIERVPELHGVKRPGEEHAWHDLEYMMGLDKLGVKYHRPTGEYHSVEVFLAENFSAAHGAKAGPYGGAPRDASKHEGSRAVGHAHKASITVVVRYREGRAIQHVHLSIPTMARRDLGYADTPDTHQGFATLTLHENGTWNAELALYDDHHKTLWWRDQIYTA